MLLSHWFLTRNFNRGCKVAFKISHRILVSKLLIRISDPILLGFSNIAVRDSDNGKVVNVLAGCPSLSPNNEFSET